MAKRKAAMSKDHKEALAVGRAEGRAVRAYLEALDAHRPRRGRKRTSESVTRRLESIEDELGSADALKRLQLTQEQFDLRSELEALEDPGDLTAVEDAFVDVARSYADRKGISYAAFRQIGVPASVLKQAGITRSR